MKRQGKALLAIVCLLSTALAMQGVAAQTAFESTSYYILSLGPIQVDLSALAETAKQQTLSVIVYEESGASVAPAPGAPSDLAQLEAADDVLIVDADRFHLRRTHQDFIATVRPSEAGYELVINPLADVSLSDALADVLVDLQGMGLLGNDVNLEYAAFSKADLKGPAPPDGVSIDSTLYGLVTSENWFVYATLKGIHQTGLRVEVVAEMLPDAQLPDALSAYVVEASSNLTKLLIPIDQLLPLARSSAVGYVRLPYQPSVP